MDVIELRQERALTAGLVCFAAGALMLWLISPGGANRMGTEPAVYLMQVSADQVDAGAAWRGTPRFGR